MGGVILRPVLREPQDERGRGLEGLRGTGIVPVNPIMLVYWAVPAHVEGREAEPQVPM